MTQEEIVKKIKNRNWDNRVQRPGFYQSKQIVVEAKAVSIKLTESTSVIDPDNIWIDTTAAYNQDTADKLFNDIFPKAFSEDKNWPVRLVEELDNIVLEKDRFIKIMQETDWSKENSSQKIIQIKKYVDLLFYIQKYYAFAVPLTNYCEKLLKEKDGSLLKYAVQYKPLDVDFLNDSLFKIKEAFNKKEHFDSLIDEHLRRFGWIKTNYNIVDTYNKDDVLNEIKSDLHLFHKEELPNSKFNYLVVALQCGIYLRNRMKELSQQLWFSYDRFAIQTAKELNISREDFLQMHYKEAINSLSLGKLSLDLEEIKKRHKGFVCGILDEKEFLLTGEVVKELFDYFNKVDVSLVKDVRGAVASKGFVEGIVRVIKNISESSKLNDGDILVTSMTTPDFVVVMKKAGAIVTDEGGLSCHAAIVSRELKKPCIIGTKIATKVLKDGDLVEVNANEGVVKVIKSK